MTTETMIVVAVVVVLAVVALAWVYTTRQRRERLRTRFGPEYERTVHDVGSEEKAKIAKAHGCDHPIIYTREDFVARVNEITRERFGGLLHPLLIGWHVRCPDLGDEVERPGRLDRVQDHFRVDQGCLQGVQVGRRGALVEGDAQDDPQLIAIDRLNVSQGNAAPVEPECNWVGTR